MKSWILWVDDDECHKIHTIRNNKREEVLKWDIEKKEYQKEYTRHYKREGIKEREKVDNIFLEWRVTWRHRYELGMIKYVSHNGYEDRDYQ